MRRTPHLLALMLLSGLAAASGTARFSPMDIFALEFALGPQIAPDGQRIVYTRRSADVMTDRRYSNIWVLDSDGGGHRALTEGRGLAHSPRWSPDGARIAYISNHEGSSQLYVMDLDSGRSKRLTRQVESASSPSWSPDGRQIAFLSVVPARPPLAVDLPPKPAGAQWDTKRPHYFDQLKIRYERKGYFRGHTQLFLVPATGGTVRQLTAETFDHGSTGGGEWEQGAGIAWSSDSQFLIFSANRRADHEFEPFDTEVYELSVRNGQIRALTDRRGPDAAPVVSPDGRLIAYLGFDDHYLNYQASRLHVMNRNGSEKRILSKDLDRSVRNARWAPNGQGLYFLYGHHGQTRLAYMTLEGELKEVAGDVGTGWMNYGFDAAYSVAGDGRIVYTFEDAHTPGALSLVEQQSGKSGRILWLNRDLLVAKELGEVEEIWFPSSLDQKLIHGWLMKPPGFDPSRKYPLILEIHGSRKANIGGNRFDVEKQLYAAHDYLVLFINFRGSTTYGEAFANLTHHRYPSDEFYDLDAAVDTVLERPYVDGRALFVTGGSGGGMLTLWMIANSDRFSAAVSQYPATNLVSFALSAEPIRLTKYWTDGLPWKVPEQYWKYSLLSSVERVKTPTMMMVGLVDWATPHWETEQYYTALKLRGVETVLALFPDEPHGIRVRPSHHIEKVLSILAWFEAHKPATDR